MQKSLFKHYFSITFKTFSVRTQRSATILLMSFVGGSRALYNERSGAAYAFAASDFWKVSMRTNWNHHSVRESCFLINVNGNWSKILTSRKGGWPNWKVVDSKGLVMRHQPACPVTWLGQKRRFVSSILVCSFQICVFLGHQFEKKI